MHYESKLVTRAVADRRLRLCIRAKGHPVLAWVYWAGVRSAGWWFWRKARPPLRRRSRQIRRKILRKELR